MSNNIRRIWILPVALLAVVGVYFLPPVNARLSPRVDDLRTRLVYFFNPPDEAVFEPSGSDTFETVLATTRAEYAQTITPEVKTTPSPASGPSPTPTITPTPLPETVMLDGVIYVDQCNRWNYCGPSNLTMALNFWGWEGDRDDVAKGVKPGNGDPELDFIQQGKDDKNVMPYEMVDFVNEETGFRALQRYGGDLELVKRLVVAGFPVVIEKGYYERDYAGKVAWLGHYSFVTGYDDAREVFIWQDTYPPPQCKGNGRDVEVSYATVIEGWRPFNYLFMVVYPPAREAELLELLWPWSDANWAARHALETAENEIETLTGIDLFFAWFAKGTSHVALQQYVDAAIAYDQAFNLYNSLDNTTKQRPYRMMWYQTGPYFAYYYSARYQDVIELADTTLTQTISTPTLEESLLWRGRAYYMIGDTQRAIEDYRAALNVHANWGPAVAALQDLGLQP
jgi:tetratricopeptide (TPR) repeat protein